MQDRIFLTNNYSILSKYSSAAKNYFLDPLLIELIENEIEGPKNYVNRRTALINRGYSARQMAVKWIVEKTLYQERVDCFIILGAGFDTLSLRDLPPGLSRPHWIEIDLLHVIEFKRDYISKRFMQKQSKPTEDPCDGNVTSFPLMKLHLVACNLRHQDDLLKRLSYAFSLIPENERRRVAILNEVCLCYLEPSEVKQVIETIKGLLTQSAISLHYVGFEPIKPHKSSQFSTVMINHFEYVGFPLKHFPTAEELKDLFKNKLGFDHLNVWPLYNLYHKYLRNSRIPSIEPFDEYEELDLYLSHYSINTGVAYLRALDTVSPGIDLTTKTEQDVESPFTDLCKRLDTVRIKQYNLHMIRNRNVQRYAHASCVLSETAEHKIIFVSGGFGKYADTNLSQQHQRLEECLLIGFDNSGHMQSGRFNTYDRVSGTAIRLNDLLGRMHGQMCQFSTNLVFFNGGRKTPQMSARGTGEVPNSFIVSYGRFDDLDGLQISLEAELVSDKPARWRHRTLKHKHDSLIQVGGLRNCTGIGAPKESPIGLWNVSSDRCGFHPIEVSSEQAARLQRHTFGMDLRDENSVLLFGGLQTENPVIEYNDTPVLKECGVMLLDLRAPNLKNVFRCDNLSYDSQVHFINAYQFIKMGGVSTETGFTEDYIELYDLRISRTVLPMVLELNPYVRGSQVGVFMPTKMTSVHFKQTREVISIGGGGNYFTYGTHFNEHHLRVRY